MITESISITPEENPENSWNGSSSLVKTPGRNKLHKTTVDGALIYD